MSNRNNIKLGDIEKLRADISKLKTIGEWKKKVKEFANEFGLTDREAIDIANDRI